MNKLIRTNIFYKTRFFFACAFFLNASVFAQSVMYSNASTPGDLAAMRTIGFTDMIVALWSVQPNGDITWGPNTICSNGNYTMGNTLPSYAADMAALKSPGSSIKRLEVGLGGWGNGTYTNIRNLINAQGTGTGSILYRNFRALKNAIPAIDAVNDDDEATYDANATIRFAVMLSDIGFKYTLSPYMNNSHWRGVVSNINSQRPGALDRIYVQCYDGGAGNNPCDWNFGVPLYAGMWDYDSGATIESKLTNWKNSCGVVGGMMWFERTAYPDRINYSDIINRVFGVYKSSTGLVTTYQDVNFTGFSGGFAVGDYNLNAIRAMGVADNSITSVKVSEGYKIILYFDDNFTGQSVEITSNNGFVGNFNDQVTSLRVRPNGTPNKNGTYYIQNRASNLYMDVDGISTADGAAIRQQGINYGTNQQFVLTDRGDGSYSIIAKHSGKGLDVLGISTASGAVINQWSYVGGGNQQFILYPTDNGYYKLFAKHDGMVVEVSTNTAGEQLHQWWNHGGANAQWRLVPLPSSTTGLVTAFQDVSFGGYSAGFDAGDYNLTQLRALGVLDNDITSFKIAEGYKVTVYDGDNFTGATADFTATTGWLADWNDKITSLRVRANGDPNIAGVYYLQNRNSGLDADVFGLSTADGANMAQGTYNGGANQQFRLEHLVDGAYKVIALHSLKVMEVSAISKDNGANVHQWTYNGTPNQQFIAVSTGDGFYKLIAKHSGKVVEVAGASLENNANIQQWDNNNQTCGQWKFVPVVAVNGNGDGLTGNYFQGMNFETPKLARKDATLNFDWGNGSPDASLTIDSYSARWTGQVQPRYSGEYTFYINSDNGRRLWVNGQLLIDKWLDDVAENAGKITLTAGTKYDIKVEYFENYGGANIKLEWSSALQAREVVPTAQLYPNPVPVVSITSPVTNASFIAPATIAINVNATDNVSVTKVDFYNGTILLGSDNTSPYSFSWTNVALGNYSIKAIATDNTGAFAISSSIVISVKADQLTGTGDGLSGNYFNGMDFETAVYSKKDATLNMDWSNGSPNPTVNADQFSARWTGQIQPKYSGEYTFYINSDNGRRVWVNGELLVDNWADNWGTEYSGKITLIAQQKYDIKVEYFENVGGANILLSWSSALQTKEVIPTSQLYANPLPTVAVSSSTTNVTGPANITLSAAAADADGISKVDFYNGTTLLGTDNSSPYSYAWNNVAVGTYTVKALATDAKGGVTLSSEVIIKVNSILPPNVGPAVNLTSPANSASYNAPASITIAANASDSDGSIAKVEFYNGTQKLGEDASSPYAYTWTNVVAGNYTLTAKAYDNTGAVSISAVVAVKVVTVVTDQCAGIGTYVENGGYVAASKVKNAGKRYECKEFPYSGWCNGAAWAYAPGTGAYWTDAWYERGSCSARTGEADENSETLLIAPNPASDVITINLNETSSVSLYNSQGMEVMSSTKVAAHGQVVLTQLSSGIYLIKIDTGSRVITQTLIKN